MHRARRDLAAVQLMDALLAAFIAVPIVIAWMALVAIFVFGEGDGE